MLEYTCFNSREEWLEGRKAIPGIGASEAAAILGLSNWKSPVLLWEEKTGKRMPKDISDNAHVAYGTKAEDHIRALFMLKHQEYRLTHRPYDFVYQSERPWLRSTLDGELTEIATGEKGHLEVKSALCDSRADWEAWNGRVPDHYLVQLEHQFLSTGWSFCWLAAELLRRDGSSVLRNYFFLREDYREDLEYLLGKEEAFWGCVKSGRPPAAILRL